MSERNGWITAREHIVFIVALVTAFALVWWLDQREIGGASVAAAAGSASAAWTRDPATPAPSPPLAKLTEEELESARAAWAYFETNVRPGTGLVDTIKGYPSTSMWDTASFLVAAIAAERLALLPKPEFDAAVGPALASLSRMPLFDGKLPNKAYDTRSLAMVDYTNAPSEVGIGWSALDIGRMLVPLHVLMRHYPDHAGSVAKVLDRWDLDAAVRDGVLMGALPTGQGYELVQEGRLGYEQYAAKGYSLFGLPVGEAQRTETHLLWVEVQGVEVPEDKRDHERFGAHTHTLSEPYILEVLEYGWDPRLADLAWRVYRAQEARHQQTGQLTAVSEDHLDRAPHFVYSTVIGNNEPWAVLTPSGEPAPGARTLSTKAAQGWHALYDTPYTVQLAKAVAPLRTPQGWRAGLYEESGEPNNVLSANTNAVILESLHWRALGPFLHPEGLPKDGASSPTVPTPRAGAGEPPPGSLRPSGQGSDAITPN